MVHYNNTTSLLLLLLLLLLLSLLLLLGVNCDKLSSAAMRDYINEYVARYNLLHSAPAISSTSSTSRSSKKIANSDDDDDDDDDSDEDDNDDSNAAKREKAASLTPNAKKFNALVSELRSFKDDKFHDLRADNGTTIIDNTTALTNTYTYKDLVARLIKLGYSSAYLSTQQRKVRHHHSYFRHYTLLSSLS